MSTSQHAQRIILSIRYCKYLLWNEGRDKRRKSKRQKRNKEKAWDWRTARQRECGTSGADKSPAPSPMGGSPWWWAEFKAGRVALHHFHGDLCAAFLEEWVHYAASIRKLTPEKGEGMREGARERGVSPVIGCRGWWSTCLCVTAGQCLWQNGVRHPGWHEKHLLALT